MNNDNRAIVLHSLPTGKPFLWIFHGPRFGSNGIRLLSGSSDGGRSLSWSWRTSKSFLASGLSGMRKHRSAARCSGAINKYPECVRYLGVCVKSLAIMIEQILIECVTWYSQEKVRLCVGLLYFRSENAFGGEC
jgi:hypothetical protein